MSSDKCQESTVEPMLTLANGMSVPQLAFGLYKVDSEDTILEAIRAGYRSFDTATYYGNESLLGSAIEKSGIPRKDFFIVSKVWNDAQKAGTVRESVLASIQHIGGYCDLFLIHWPVPGYFIQTYKVLEELHNEGKLRSLGLSNFSPQEYEELLPHISVAPVVNQFEVSPFMYRKDLVQYFQDCGIVVSASKALHRAAAFHRLPFETKSKTPAQIMLRWALQKQLIVVSKTSTPSRMKENRDILDFTLSADEMALLDGLTTKEAVEAREELEKERKMQM